MVNLALPPGLLDVVRDDTWHYPVPPDRMLEHVLDWLNQPANHNQAAPLLRPLLARCDRAQFRDDEHAKSG
jgi:hypothetical protein